MSFISDRNNNTTARGIRFIHELPYIERKLLRDALDINNKWEELGGVYMGFDYATLFRIGQAVMRNQSPTDELLSLWSSQNHTILELFKLLWKMEHYQAMRILKPFVEERYHHLIYEGENSTCSQLLQRNVPTAPPEHHFSGSRGRAPSHQNNPQGNFPVAQSSSGRRPTCDETRPKTERRVQEMTLEACSPLIPYKELQIATNNWDESRVIGRGGFGVVFKGRWKNTEVAIKRLVPPRSNESVDYFIEMQRQQSMRELKFLNNFQHDNILPLYGYSIGGERPCLVYKYMSNGSLEDRIRCRNNTVPLSWARRVSIGVGTARGLQFLHERDTPLIHGDIKSANILLDANLEPKIGDFGLAREGPVQQYTHVTLVKIHGTRPYLPDEFLRGKKLSIKVDTYSFGVVLCELATGLKAFDDTRKEKYLRDHVHSCDDKNIIKLMDVKGGSDDNTFYLPLISLAKKCSSQLPKDRPKMVDVLETLEALWDQRKIPYVRKPSLPLSSVSHVHPAWMFLSPSPSKQPLHIALSTSPTYQGSQQHPLLPQVPESARYNRTPFETTPGNELNVPQIQVNIPSSPSAQTHETNVTHSPDKQSSENRRMTPPIAEQSSVSLSSSEYTSETEASSNELSCNQPAEMPLDTGTAMIPDVSLLNISEE